MRAAVRLSRSLAALAVLASAGTTRAQEPPVTYEVFAVRYATLAGFPVAGLVAGADTSRRMDIAMMVWLLRGSDGRNVLVDAGFHRAPLVRRWHPADYRTPPRRCAPPASSRSRSRTSS